MTHDPNEAFFRELADYDAAYDETWLESDSDHIETLNAGILAKLGFVTPTPETLKIVEQANRNHYRHFNQRQIVESCQAHDQLVVLHQNGYYLVGSDYRDDQLIRPTTTLDRQSLQLFVAEMWGQWVEIPVNGWKIDWELEVVSDTECVLHPYISSLFSLMEVDPSDEVYVLHEIITEALGLELLEIPL